MHLSSSQKLDNSTNSSMDSRYRMSYRLFEQFTRQIDPPDYALSYTAEQRAVELQPHYELSFLASLYPRVYRFASDTAVQDSFCEGYLSEVVKSVRSMASRIARRAAYEEEKNTELLACSDFFLKAPTPYGPNSAHFYRGAILRYEPYRQPETPIPLSLRSGRSYVASCLTEGERRIIGRCKDNVEPISFHRTDAQNLADRIQSERNNGSCVSPYVSDADEEDNGVSNQSKNGSDSGYSSVPDCPGAPKMATRALEYNSQAIPFNLTQNGKRRFSTPDTNDASYEAQCPGAPRPKRQLRLEPHQVETIHFRLSGISNTSRLRHSSLEVEVDSDEDDEWVCPTTCTTSRSTIVPSDAYPLSLSEHQQIQDNPYNFWFQRRYQHTEVTMVALIRSKE